jgi:imidazole glycerol-phosphate synthase subunit HisH
MKIAIVDYGMGNLQSVFNSVQSVNKVETLNAEIVLTADSGDILSADKIIFPGQGVMPDCMASLHKSGLVDVLQDCLQNKPFLGICVGAQLLFEYSEEGNTAGLGWFKGTVARLSSGHVDGQGRYLKVPHMGWNQVHQTQTHPLFAAIKQNEWFYFVHSYYFLPRETDTVLATADYPDKFACIVGKDNVFATQFHTEKSHTAGLQLLQNFLLWNG